MNRLKVIDQTYKFTYDTSKYQFRDTITNMLNVENLQYLHEIKNYPMFERKNDQSSQWHERFYKTFHKTLQPLYELFLDKVVKKEMKLEEVVYQKIPAFRAQLVENLAVGEWHRDKDYGHTQGEINLWMPFHDTNRTNSIWIEVEEGSEDYRPYTVRYGEVLVFDGRNLKHGNKVNKELYTRTSMDFRIVDPKNFNPSSDGSINTNLKFDIGSYFEKR